MFRKEEKKSIVRLALLSIGWGLGLDRFYEGQKKEGVLSIIGWGAIFTSLMLLSPCDGSSYVDGVKTYSDVSPLLILPLGFGVYGAFLIIRKGFRLLRSFENAE